MTMLPFAPDMPRIYQTVWLISFLLLLFAFWRHTKPDMPDWAARLGALAFVVAVGTKPVFIILSHW
jgi:hypothetical protein